MSDSPIVAVAVWGDGVPQKTRELVELAASRANALAAALCTPTARVTFVIAPDFPAAVEDAWRRGGHPHTSFSGGRLGGQVMAKTIAMDAVGAEARVVFNAEITPKEDDDGIGQIRWLKLAVHELTHVILTRLRHASGLTHDVRHEDLAHPRPAMGAAITKAIDELRCDLYSNDLVAGTATLEGGSVVPIAELVRFGYLEEIMDTAENKIAHGWRAGITDARFRNDHIAAISFIGRQTDSALNLLARAEAEARWLGAPSLLSNATFAAHPAIKGIVGPVWSTIIGVFDEMPFPTVPDFVAQERRILDVGYGAIVQMWARLGLVVTDLGDEFGLAFAE